MLFKKTFLTILLLSFGFFPLSAAAIPDEASKEETRLGVWITVFSSSKVTYSKENADTLISICKDAGINDIYLQVYRADKAYYDSALTDNAPYRKMLAESGQDMLRYLIDKAHKNGLKIHAWVNTLSLAQNTEANILKKFGKEVLTTDQHGRTPLRKGNKDALDKYYIRENQLFLDPGDGRVKKYIVSIAQEIIEKYPGFDGLHLDYIRYPSAVPFIPGSRFTSHGLSYGYERVNLKNFKDTTGLDVKTMPPTRQNYALWDEWKRKQVTSLVRDISAAARALSPFLEISCAVVPSIERTYLDTFQDWTLWLKEGVVDHIVAMNYTDDNTLMRLRSESLFLPGLTQKIRIGVGAYLLKDKPEDLREQLKTLNDMSPAGIVIFSYDDIVSNEDLQGFLGETFNPKAQDTDQKASEGSQ